MQSSVFLHCFTNLYQTSLDSSSFVTGLLGVRFGSLSASPPNALRKSQIASNREEFLRASAYHLASSGSSFLTGAYNMAKLEQEGYSTKKGDPSLMFVKHLETIFLFSRCCSTVAASLRYGVRRKEIKTKSPNN
jgi:hypothetical protein